MLSLYFQGDQMVAKIRTCRDVGLVELYHYQPWERSWIENLLMTGTVRFSSPASFNDPWDCQPCFYNDLKYPSAEYDEHVAWFEAQHLAQYPGLAGTRKAKTEELRNTPGLMREYIEQLSAGVREEMRQKHRVYCLSARPDSTLMWAHYADDHSGLCLGFGTDDTLFCSATEVIYSEEYPRLVATASSVDENLLPFYSKAGDWTYEKEYRLVSEEVDHATSDETIKTKDGFLEVPPTALRSITIGCRASPDVKSELKKLIEMSKKPVKLREARVLRDRYALEIHDL